jgi:sporulation protein YlmC with PRC-barrel domain
MFPAENVRSWRGKTVIDLEGKRVGELEAVYVDTTSDEPSFFAIKMSSLTGRLRLVFVPATGATVTPETLRVQYPKSLVKDAPWIRTDGELGADVEPDVFAHYRLAYIPGSGGERRLARG